MLFLRTIQCGINAILTGGLIVLTLFAFPIAAATWIPLSGPQNQIAPPAIEVIHNDFNNISLQVRIAGFSHEAVQTPRGSFTRLDLEGEGFTTEIGEPQLPVIRRFVEIPYGASVNLQVISSDLREISLADLAISNRIIPVQPEIEKRPGAIERAPFVLDESAYQKSGFTAAPIAMQKDEGYARGSRFIMLEISPFDYNPADGRLRVYTEMQLQINLSGADQAKTRAQKARLQDGLTQKLAHRQFLNAGAYDDPDVIPTPLGFLIISAPAYAGLPLLNDFVTWKEQKGLHTTLVTTQETGASAAQIKAYIQDAYDNWPIPPNFVLLIGDVQDIPCWTGQGPGNPSTDLYYSTLEGNDCFCDVGLGRWPISNAEQLANIINKTLNYEQVLWSGDDWEKAAVLMASNDMWYMTEATHDYVIRAFLYPDGYHSSRLYCHSFGATTQQVSDNLNAGRSLAIYSGHGYYFCWLDGPLFLQHNVSDLTNTYYPFVGSFACDTGQFMRVPECFGETWIRSPHGAIAFLGAAAESYWGPDDVMERELYEGFFNEQMQQVDGNLTWVSGMTQYAKMSLWLQEGGGEYCVYYWEIYNLLGDPSIDVWTDVPQNLAVTFPTTIQIGQTNLQVGVSGYPDWALVNVYSDAEELQFTGYVTNGVVNFDLGSGFTVPGTLHVWVTGHDCRPYHGTAAIVAAGDQELGAGAAPNPFNPSTVFSFELRAASHVNLGVYDISGRLVATLVDGWREAGVHKATFDGSALASGIYVYRLEASGSDPEGGLGSTTPTTISGKMVLLK